MDYNKKVEQECVQWNYMFNITDFDNQCGTNNSERANCWKNDSNYVIHFPRYNLTYEYTCTKFEPKGDVK